MLKQITPALVLDKHMIPCRDENEKRLLYAYLSKKRELAEHLSQIIYVLYQILEGKGDDIGTASGCHAVVVVVDGDIADAHRRENLFQIVSGVDIVP